MQDLSIRITTSSPAGDVQTVDISTIPQTPSIEVVAAEAIPPVSPPDGPRFMKIGVDGARLPAGSTRTDHVAVIDNTTGLMWAVESLGDPADEDDGIAQEHCIERCKQLRLLGFDDWRLPTRGELAGLVDDTRHEPAIDVDVFPRVKPNWHWTSTAAAWSSASAWFVSFGYGSVSYLPRNDVGFALACRRAGQ